MDDATFSPPSHQILREISRSTGDRTIYYLATDQVSQQKVIISRYRLLKNKDNFVSSCNHPEILPSLKAIKSDGILPYLDSFATVDSVCLVQEYCDIFPLVVDPQTNLQNIYQITLQILKILTHLQSSSSPVFDCNLSPANLWIDQAGKIYLMDFGYAHIGDRPMPLAMAKLGRNSEFIAPEKQRHRPLTEKSDLYSLGVTVVYWLLGKKADKTTTLKGSDGSINVAGLVPETVSLEWIEWLEKMVAISPRDRFMNAATALANFQDIYLERSADLQINPDRITFKANYYGEILSQTLTIFNPVPNTNLSGQIDFQDSRGNFIEQRPSWLTASPSHFDGNKIDIQLTVDTSQLMAQKNYYRSLVIQANSNQKVYILPLVITTAKIEAKSIFQISLLPLLFIALVCGWLGGFVVSWTPSPLSWLALLGGWAVGAYGMVGASIFHVNYLVQSVAVITALSIGLGLVSMGGDVDLILGFISGLLMVGVGGYVVKSYLLKKYSKSMIFSLVGLSILFGISLGVNLALPQGNFGLFGVSAVCGTLILLMLAFPYWQYADSLKKYRQKSSLLVKP
ncbi:MAG: hypothetical protein RLZZ490_2370 [Cyanobacteriota bacterium]|jgi:serine/threonine protein kinase